MTTSIDDQLLYSSNLSMFHAGLLILLMSFLISCYWPFTHPLRVLLFFNGGPRASKLKQLIQETILFLLYIFLNLVSMMSLLLNLTSKLSFWIMLIIYLGKDWQFQSSSANWSLWIYLLTIENIMNSIDYCTRCAFRQQMSRDDWGQLIWKSITY